MLYVDRMELLFVIILKNIDYEKRHTRFPYAGR